MGLLKRELHQFEELYPVSGFDVPNLFSAHLSGLCLRCGEPFDKTLRAGIFCPECQMWVMGDNMSS